MPQPFSLDLRQRVVAAAQHQTQAAVAAPTLRRPEDIVFVDESGVATNMARLYGRAPGGQRAGGVVPHGRWERLTILGGLSLDGLVACLAVEGATDTAVMVAFTQHVLVPALRPGQTVLLDNLSVHRAARVRRLIEAAGCRLLFLPPYSPDFNPIEHAWSKLKTQLRGMGGPHHRRAAHRFDGPRRHDHGQRCPQLLRTLRVHCPLSRELL